MIDLRKNMVGLIQQVVIPYWANIIADHLIENGVTIPVCGRWVMGFSVHCSVCNGYALTDEDHDPWLTPYCPNCGAKMDGGSHEVD
jgi:hypothetical protein